jgi:hypothetical protein
MRRLVCGKRRGEGVWNWVKWEGGAKVVGSAQNYWVFGLCSLAHIPKNIKEHNILETGSVSVLK